MEQLLQIFSDVLEIPKELIDMETKKEDLEQWDSLSHIQLILEVEQFYNVQIPFEETVQINKIGDFLKYI
ncbi:acyl carrier protein [Clostridium sporogenes]|uniref:acyl carrier protein n=1 Tax=Clostridium sporogenes TaxID=1509 RepID=UPI0022374D53|nr:acyl carrier protein [Clostridium sporogenes]MCW6077021.1 acyl carrier protein [Clostridium sporogenes]